MTVRIKLTVDDQECEIDVEPRMLLVQALREKLGVTGPHIGCESGRCGACTILLDGHAIKSCMTLAVQADDGVITTAASLENDLVGDALQKAFHEHHALQCGYCTPGMLSAATDLLKTNTDPSDYDVRMALRGNLCRCTGYQHIVEAVLAAASSLKNNGERAA